MPAYITPADNALRDQRQQTLNRIAQDHFGINNASCAATLVLDVQALRAALESAFEAGRQTEYTTHQEGR